MNLQFLAENTFVISLKEREDRRKNVTKEMRNQKIAFQFFDGIKDANPIYGCTASHVGVIKIAKEKKLPYVLIFEDDAKFVQPFRLPVLPDNWDMLYLGSCVNKIYDEYYYNWKKVCCWYGHSYIVRECMYDRIIE
jgi:GR25 family glycosyltransferase involved in LPS biosynthesis